MENGFDDNCSEKSAETLLINARNRILTQLTQKKNPWETYSLSSTLIRPKVHWDYLIDEIKWMSIDYKQELRWKISMAKNIAYACQEQRLKIIKNNSKKTTFPSQKIENLFKYSFLQLNDVFQSELKGRSISSFGLQSTAGFRQLIHSLRAQGLAVDSQLYLHPLQTATIGEEVRVGGIRPPPLSLCFTEKHPLPSPSTVLHILPPGSNQTPTMHSSPHPQPSPRSLPANKEKNSKDKEKDKEKEKDKDKEKDKEREREKQRIREREKEKLKPLDQTMLLDMRGRRLGSIHPSPPSSHPISHPSTPSPPLLTLSLPLPSLPFHSSIPQSSPFPFPFSFDSSSSPHSPELEGERRGRQRDEGGGEEGGEGVPEGCREKQEEDEEKDEEEGRKKEFARHWVQSELNRLRTQPLSPSPSLPPSSSPPSPSTLPPHTQDGVEGTGAGGSGGGGRGGKKGRGRGKTGIERERDRQRKEGEREEESRGDGDGGGIVLYSQSDLDCFEFF